jgi:hypothetical protein
MSTIQHGSTSPGQWMRSETAERPARVAAVIRPPQPRRFFYAMADGVSA